MAVETFYRPGLVFKSKTSAHQEVCRSRSEQKAMDGTIISTIRELLAEFAFISGDYTYINPETGDRETAPDIRGHYFDLDQQAEAKDWDKNEKEIVARHMIRMCNKGTPDFGLWSKPATPAPWSTYDETDAAKIADIAEATGFAEQALAYEKENANRKAVVTALDKLLSAAKVEEEFAAA